MKLAEELLCKWGFSPDNGTVQAWQSNKALTSAVNEALERAAQECEKMIDAGAAKYAARIRALISGGGK